MIRSTSVLTDETCWEDPSFCDWWAGVSAAIADDWWATHVLGCADDGWQLRELLDGYAKGMSPAAAIAAAVADYDPTP